MAYIHAVLTLSYTSTTVWGLRTMVWPQTHICPVCDVATITYTTSSPVPAAEQYQRCMCITIPITEADREHL